MNEGYLLLGIILATIAVGIYAAFNPVIFGLQGGGSHRRPVPRLVLKTRRPRPIRVQRRVQPVQRLNPRSAHHNAGSHDSERSVVNVQKRTDQVDMSGVCVAFVASNEIAQLTRALTLKSQGATEQAAIEAAFECTKGAGAGWRRGKALYDLATTFEGKQS